MRKWAPKKLKTSFFQDKLYSLKARAHYCTALIYITTKIAAELGIFTHFTPKTYSDYLKHQRSYIYYMYTIHRVLDQSRGRTSSYYRRPKQFAVLPPEHISFCQILWRLRTNLIHTDGNTNADPAINVGTN